MTYAAGIERLSQAGAFDATRADVLASATELTDAMGDCEAALGSLTMSTAVSAALVLLLADLRTVYGAMGALDGAASTAGSNYSAAEGVASTAYRGPGAR